jgi:hypothetical protein
MFKIMYFTIFIRYFEFNKKIFEESDDPLSTALVGTSLTITLNIFTFLVVVERMSHLLIINSYLIVLLLFVMLILNHLFLVRKDQYKNYFKHSKKLNKYFLLLYNLASVIIFITIVIFA